MRNTYLLACVLMATLTSCGIKSAAEGQQAIEERFARTFQKAKQSKTGTLLVDSERLNIHIRAAAGTAGGAPGAPAQPFHVASIGKVFTAVLVLQYVEAGKLALQDRVQKFLGAEILKQLFVTDGHDHASEVTIAQLLSHTSGIDDYFDSKHPGSKSVLAEILNQPHKFWQPAELIDFTRKNQKAVARPGKIFHYSDTGYILLGLILEKISGKSFEVLIHGKIFGPLHMQNTYMHLRSSPKNKRQLPLSTMMLGDKDVTNFKSISADWAGGGVISTTEDLLLFQRALISGKLIPSEVYKSMQGTHKFMDGIYYGLGLMTVRYGDMSVIMPKSPDLYGHSGLLSTLMFYSPDYDTHIIANLGSTEDISATFEMMFWLLRSVKEISGLKKQ